MSLRCSQPGTHEFTYDSHGSVVMHRGPVYGPNPDPSELAALTSTWNYQYPAGYTLLAAETGPLGHNVSYTWNSNYDLTQVSYESGARVHSYTYDSSGRRTHFTVTCGTQSMTWQYVHLAPGSFRTIDPRGKVSEVHFDAFGRLTLRAGPADSVSDLLTLIAQNKVLSYTYDSTGNLTSETNELGATTTYTYDSSGNMTSATDPSGVTESATYNAQNRLSTITYATAPQGMANRYFYYDSAGKLQAQAQRFDAQTLVFEGYKYDPQDRLTHIVGPAYSLNDVTTMIANTTNVLLQFAYDSLGRRTTEVHSTGESMTWTYDARGNVLTEMHNDGRIWSAGWDYLDRCTYDVDVDGTTSTRVYDSLGRPITRYGRWNDANGNRQADDADVAVVVSTQFDLLDQPVSRQVDLQTPVTIAYDYVYPIAITRGQRTSLRQYDAIGRLTSTSDPGGSTCTFEFDAAGRLTSARAGATTSSEVREDFAYDAADRVTAITRYPISLDTSSGVTETFGYDAGGLLAGGVGIDSVAWTLQRDMKGYVVASQRGSGKVTSRVYNAVGQLLGVNPHGGPALTYSYDTQGRLTSVLETAQGTTHAWQYTYDSVGRQNTATYPDGSTLTKTFDSMGRLSSETTTLGTTTYTRSCQFDGRSRISSVTDGSSSYSYVHDAYDRLISRTDQFGRTFAYAFDEDDDLVSAQYPSGDLFTYAYDSYKRLSCVSRTAGGLTAVIAAIGYDVMGRDSSRLRANGFRETTTYDGMNRILAKAVLDPSSVVVAKQTATRSNAGRLLAIAHLNGDTETFSYDVDGQLVGATRTGATVFNSSYAYDTAGNLVTETMNGAVTNYTYNGVGQLTSKTSPSGPTTYAYDGAGNLVMRTDPNSTDTYTYDLRGLQSSATNTTSGQTTLFSYDVFGRRSSKLSAGNLESYALTPDGRRAERYVNGNLYETSRYGFGEAPTDVWRGGSAYAYVNSLVSNVDRIIDQAGVTTAYVYDPFGTVLSGSVASGQAAYQGLCYDMETNQSYNRARQYSAADRRFCSADPLRLRWALGPY